MSAVTVVKPFQVVHQGTPYGPGTSIEVPDDVAESWIALGWVEAAKTKKKTKGSPSVVRAGAGG